jgi:uncharacterized protein YfbU (UPF0304 family)
MKTQSPDTHPEIERILIEAYRRMTPAEKLRKVRQLNEFGYRLALAEVRRRHPDASERECQLRVASRYLPAELMRKAFHWDPERQGY